MPPNKRGWEQHIAPGLLGVVLSLLVLVGGFGASFPTRADVSEQIRLESPYSADQRLILHRLEVIERKLDQLLRAPQRPIDMGSPP
jgi:hypothetical protein